MKKITLLLFCCALSVGIYAQKNQVEVVNNELGMRLTVDGKPFIVNGVNWDYFPIGTNYSYSLWNQSDDIIKRALDSEMSLLKNMIMSLMTIVEELCDM